MQTQITTTTTRTICNTKKRGVSENRRKKKIRDNNTNILGRILECYVTGKQDNINKTKARNKTDSSRESREEEEEEEEEKNTTNINKMR